MNVPVMKKNNPSEAMRILLSVICRPYGKESAGKRGNRQVVFLGGLSSLSIQQQSIFFPITVKTVIQIAFLFPEQSG